MTATELWIWTIEVVPDAPGNAGGTAGMPDITGYQVSARDGDIGKVEEVVSSDDGRDTSWSIRVFGSSRRSA